MTDPHLTEFDTQKVNLKTYNNILRKAIRLVKKTYYEIFFYNLRIILEEREQLLVEFLTKQRENRIFLPSSKIMKI